MNLWDIPVGGIVTIDCVACEQSLVKRINAMGIKCGTQVEIIRRAAFNGPIQIRANSTHLILRQALAKSIKVIKN